MSVFTPLSDELYSLPRAQILFRVKGTDRWTNLGDCEAFAITPNLTEIERWGKDSDTKVLRRTDVVQKGGDVKLTLLQMTDTIRGLLFMADPTSYLIQAAVTDGNAVFTDVAVGDIYSVGAVDVAVSAVTDGAAGTPVAYTEGTHYKVDRRTGFVEIIAKPGTAGDDLHITFSAPAVASTDKRFSGGFMQTNGVRGTLMARGQGAVGSNQEVMVWDVKLRPDGDIAIQGEDDYQQITLTGKMYSDGTQAPGFEYGRVRTIPKTALV